MLYRDPLTGKVFTSQAELNASQATRKSMLGGLARAKAQSEQARRKREASQATIWEGIEVNNAVLLSEKLSQELCPATATNLGQVQLDGLVLAIENGRARVRVHYLEAKSLKGQSTQDVLVERADVTALGHPFSWWMLSDLRKSAIRRSLQHGRNDAWAEIARKQFWEH